MPNPSKQLFADIGGHLFKKVFISFESCGQSVLVQVTSPQIAPVGWIVCEYVWMSSWSAGLHFVEKPPIVSVWVGCESNFVVKPFK